MTINQGALDVGGTVLASNGQVQLGATQAKERSLSLTAPPGPTVTYTVSISELPVQINGLSFGQQFAAPGGILTSVYSVTGDTAITAYVRNSTGQVVRTLATNLPVAQGSSSLTWDGRGDGGSALPDGGYTLHLDSHDPSGNATTAETTITLDGTPPAVAMTSPATISPSQAATFAVSDALSGVRDATLTVGGQKVDSLRPGGTLQYAGSSASSAAMKPLAPGTYTWSVTATDIVGNSGMRSGTFTVRVPRAPIRPARNAPDRHAKLYRASGCLVIRAEHSYWGLGEGSCADMYLMWEYFRGRHVLCYQPNRKRVACDRGGDGSYTNTATAVRLRRYHLPKGARRIAG